MLYKKVFIHDLRKVQGKGRFGLPKAETSEAGTGVSFTCTKMC